MGKQILFFILFLCLTGCSSNDQDSSKSRYANLQGEYLYRMHHESLVKLDPPTLVQNPAYPWERGLVGGYPEITKEYFRCKGSSLNPVHLVTREKEVQYIYDCGGTQRHSLPIRDGKEFVYPILIDLLNYLQKKTGKRVVVTCGHCCPDHYLYLDSNPTHQTSKHLLGAEVDFYIQGLEYKPEQIVELIRKYYTDTPKYKGLKEYEEFKRYDGDKTNVSITPWYNKEIFVKICQKNEGRDFDNRTPFPYVSIQVRYDWDLKEKVNYSWDKAFHNFQRW